MWRARMVMIFVYSRSSHTLCRYIDYRRMYDVVTVATTAEPITNLREEWILLYSIWMDIAYWLNARRWYKYLGILCHWSVWVYTRSAIDKKCLTLKSARISKNSFQNVQTGECNRWCVCVCLYIQECVDYNVWIHPFESAFANNISVLNTRGNIKSNTS